MTDKRIWVGASTTATWLAWIIRWFTKQKPSHAWVSYWDDTLQMRMVMEAEARMRVVPWDWWIEADPGKRMWVYTCKIDLMPGIREYAKLIGTKYDYKNLIWHALKRFLGTWLRRPWRSPRKVLCSELLIRIFRYDKVPGAEKMDAEASTPGDLVEYWKGSWVFEKMDMEKE